MINLIGNLFYEGIWDDQTGDYVKTDKLYKIDHNTHEYVEIIEDNEPPATSYEPKEIDFDNSEEVLKLLTNLEAKNFI